MAANKEDIEFTFNPDSFLKGVKKMSDAMNSFESHSKESTKKMEKGNEKMSSGMVAKGQIMANIFMKLAQSVVNFIKSGVPEIGKTFDIAGGIFMRNFFWPLRKELAPMLQKILDWTRDHRAMFVKWGGVLVNVFRAVIQIFKGFYRMFEAMMKPIADKLKQVFGGVASGISDIFNVLLFKITAVYMYLQVAFLPLFERIGKVIAWVIGLVEAFFNGFMDGISGISGPFQDLLNQFYRLIDLFQIGDSKTNILLATFKSLGDFIGTTLYAAISVVAGLIDLVISSIEHTVDMISLAKAKLTGTSSEVAEIQNRMAQREKEHLERQKQRITDIGKKYSEFGSRTAANFSPSSSTSSKQVTANQKVVVEKLEIKVAQGEDPKKVGEGFIEGMNKRMSQQFKNILLNEAGAQGY